MSTQIPLCLRNIKQSLAYAAHGVPLNLYVSDRMFWRFDFHCSSAPTARTETVARCATAVPCVLSASVPHVYTWGFANALLIADKNSLTIRISLYMSPHSFQYLMYFKTTTK